MSMLGLSASAVAADQFSMSTGFDYSTGKYGSSTSTDYLYIPVIAKYESDKLTLKLTVPYLSEMSSNSSTSNVIRGIGRVKTTTTTTTSATTTNAGLGDIVAAAGYSVYDKNSVIMDVVGKVKFGTASASEGLGTGMNDYSAQVDGYYAMGKTTAFGTVGYKVVGVPAGITLNNVLFGTIGLSKKLEGNSNVGLMLDVAQSESPLSAGPVEVTAFYSHKLNKDMKVQVNALKGFSNGSADYGIGALISSYF